MEHTTEKQDELCQWVDKALEESSLDDKMKNRLRLIARREINLGGLKGDISDAWVKDHPKLNAVIVPELYI